MKKILLVSFVFCVSFVVAQDTIWGNVPQGYEKYIHRDLEQIYVVFSDDIDVNLAQKELNLFATVLGLVPEEAIKTTKSTVSIYFYNLYEEKWELILEFKNNVPCSLKFVLHISADVDEAFCLQTEIGSKLDEYSELIYNTYSNKSILYRYPYFSGYKYKELSEKKALSKYDKLISDLEFYILENVNKNKTLIRSSVKNYKKSKRKGKKS